MDIRKYPQFQLYLLTLQMLMLKNQLIPENCDEWCVNASIINRAYYSAYLFCELWLEDVKKFKVKHPWDFKDNEERIGEHKQVREALKDFGEKNMKTELNYLFRLRRKQIIIHSWISLLKKSQMQSTTWKRFSTILSSNETIFFKYLKFHIHKSKLLI